MALDSWVGLARWLGRRPQASMPPKRIVLAAIAAAAVIAFLGLMAEWTGQPLLVAGFASSCMLVFMFPTAPLAHPFNLVGGHLIAAVAALVVRSFLPSTWWSIGLAVGLATAVMAVTRLAHPPAGGSPIVIMMAGANWHELLLPIVVGAVIVALFGVLYGVILRGMGKLPPLGHSGDGD